jgi:hypothetical protein
MESVQPHLHDATFLGLALQWSKNVALTARFRRDNDRHVVLKVLDVTLLHCPHEAPWGPSASVNDVIFTGGARAGTHRIAIELQSGDTIVIEGDGVEWAIEAELAG